MVKCKTCGDNMEKLNVIEGEVKTNRMYPGAVHRSKTKIEYMCQNDQCDNDEIYTKYEDVSERKKGILQKLIVAVDGSEWEFDHVKHYPKNSIFSIKQEGFYTYLGVTYNKRMIDILKGDDALRVEDFQFIGEVRENKRNVLELNFVDVIEK